MSDMSIEKEEKLFTAISSVGAIFGFIIPLIMWVLKKTDYSDYTKKFLLNVLNFELLVLIISIVLGLIPILGWIMYVGLFIFNLVVALRAFSASREQKEYEFPIKVQFVK